MYATVWETDKWKEWSGEPRVPMGATVLETDRWREWSGVPRPWVPMGAMVRETDRWREVEVEWRACLQVPRYGRLTSGRSRVERVPVGAVVQETDKWKEVGVEWKGCMQEPRYMYRRLPNSGKGSCRCHGKGD